MSPPDEAPGFDLQVFADLALELRRVADELDYQRKRQERFNTALHIINLTMDKQVTTTTQTIHPAADVAGPRTGYVWDLISLTADGMTAGSIDVYKGPVGAGNKVLSFQSAGTQIVGTGSIFLQRGDLLTFVSSGSFAGTTTLSLCAVELEEWLLADYLL